MQHEHRHLDVLFAPPANKVGTHMLICGLSADTETLERAVAAFTGESTVERAATGLLRALLMLDASAPMLGPRAVPGMLQLAPSQVAQWQAQTTLMHAKVALLGFADEKFAEPDAFRLIVSTGNWTRESWGNGAQIDMFWSTDYHLDPATVDAHARSDVAAALHFFDRLMPALYPRSTAFLSTERLAMDWLPAWKRLLPRRGKREATRFVDSLETPLIDQIESAFPTEGVSTLVAGSGFWEQETAGAAGKPEVLVRLDDLHVRGKRYLVSNPSQSGALARWVHASRRTAGSGKIGNWTLCMPADPLQSRDGVGRTRLHGKYIAGLSRVAQASNDQGTMTFLYLGSGNLSRAGLLSRARLGTPTARARSVGNVEAGVLVTGAHRVGNVWRALACGDIMSADEIESMEAGDGEPILTPRPPPPVLFAKAASGMLQLLHSGDIPVDLQVRLDATADWIDVRAGHPVALADAPPPVIWVRVHAASGQEDAEIHEVPVLTQDGILCRQAPNQLGIDDALDALAAFPASPRYLPDPGSPQPQGQRQAPSSTARRYPLKFLAALIEVIAHRHSLLKQEQCLVWLSQLRFLLLEQVTEADRAAVRLAGIDLFPALLQPGFAPSWLETDSYLDQAYRSLVLDLRRAWTDASALSFPELEVDGSNQGEPHGKQN